MASAIHRTTLQFVPRGVAKDGSTHPAQDWIINPDLAAVSGVAPKYWKISGDSVVEMTQGEKDAVDAADIAARTQAIKDAFDAGSDDLYRVIKAGFLEIVAQIPGYTAADFRAGVFSRLDGE